MRIRSLTLAEHRRKLRELMDGKVLRGAAAHIPSEAWNNCGPNSYVYSGVLDRTVNLTTRRPLDEKHCEDLDCGGYMAQVYDTRRGLHRECQKCGRKK